MRAMPIIVVGLSLVLLACQEKPFRQVPVENPVVRKNNVFKSGENLSLPKFQALKAKYQLIKLSSKTRIIVHRDLYPKL